MVKFLFRWLFRLGILAVVLVTAVLLLKDILIKSYLESRVRRQTGLETRIGSMDVGLFTPTVTFENLRIFNPASFGGLPFLELPELHLEYDRPALALGKVHLFLLRVNVNEVNIVTNTSGQNNLEWFYSLMALSTNTTTPVVPHPATAPKSPSTKLEFAGIDVLNLTIGKIRWSNLSDPRKNSETKIGWTNMVLTKIGSYDDLGENLIRIFIQSRNGASEPGQRTAPRPASPPARRGK
jgi:hypothetical protein